MIDVTILGREIGELLLKLSDHFSHNGYSRTLAGMLIVNFR
jgi:hypothetical protein